MFYLGFVRELKIFFNNKSLWSLSLLFYFIIVLSVPITLASSAVKLNSLAAIIIWMTFILSGIQLTANIFAMDYANGWYQQVFIQDALPIKYFFYKMLATTLVFIAPVALVTPILALGYNLTITEMWWLLSSMCVASPALCFLNGIFAAVTVGTSQRAGLLNVMLLPLSMPIYILGVGSAQLGMQGGKPYASLSLLAAISIVSMLIAPVLITISLRSSFEY